MEVWVHFVLSWFCGECCRENNSDFPFFVCGSVTSAMRSDVPAAHTWGCQHSNQERRLCWTTPHWQTLETTNLTHTADALKHYIPFFSIHPETPLNVSRLTKSCFFSVTADVMAMIVSLSGAQWDGCCNSDYNMSPCFLSDSPVWRSFTSSSKSCSLNLRVLQRSFDNDQEWDFSGMKQSALWLQFYSCCC